LYHSKTSRALIVIMRSGWNKCVVQFFWRCFCSQSFRFYLCLLIIHQEWNQCVSLSFRSLLYYVVISNSTFIYVLSFVINHAVQEDVLSGIPLVLIFGFFLLVKPLPGPRIIRFLAYYSVFCVISRKLFRIASAAYSVSQKNYNLTEVPPDFCSQTTDLGNNTTVFDFLSNSKYVYFTSGSLVDVFVIMAIQLHMSVLRSRGLDRYVDQYVRIYVLDMYIVIYFSHSFFPHSSKLDPFVSCNKEVRTWQQRSIDAASEPFRCAPTVFIFTCLIFSPGAHSKVRIEARCGECPALRICFMFLSIDSSVFQLTSLGLHFGRHAPLTHCTSFLVCTAGFYSFSWMWYWLSLFSLPCASFGIIGTTKRERIQAQPCSLRPTAWIITPSFLRSNFWPSSCTSSFDKLDQRIRGCSDATAGCWCKYFCLNWVKVPTILETKLQDGLHTLFRSSFSCMLPVHLELMSTSHCDTVIKAIWPLHLYPTLVIDASPAAHFTNCGLVSHFPHVP